MDKIVNSFNKSVFSDDNTIKINCPVCGTMEVCFDKPDYMESSNYKAWKGQGDCLKIPMWCPEGHMWNYCFGYHKGESFTYLDNIKNIKETTQSWKL